MKVPYIIVVGDKEEKNNTLAVRVRGDKKIKSVKMDKFVKDLKKEIDELLKDSTKKAKFQNVKGFIDNASNSLLKEEKGKDIKKEVFEGILDQSGLNLPNLINSVY
ncbi:MAG: hypothetical protein IH823_07450, partial [Candidatus Dadabacteria bacterium]|nr:hypothetical protein [Candidatus Dadabacteria bacterium]